MRNEAFEINRDRLSSILLGFFERVALSVATRQRGHVSNLAALRSLLVEN